MPIELGPLGLASHPDWCEGLPLMVTARVMLRELRQSDAPALLRLANAPDIVRHTWPAPATIDAFEKYIEWARAERSSRRYTAFAVVPRRQQTLGGLFELRSLQPGFLRAELAFLLDRPLWGSGVFMDAASLVCDFAFNAVGVHRIEARVEVDNDRANGALKKLGATREGRLRASFVREGQPIDQYLWSLVSGLDALPKPPR